MTGEAKMAKEVSAEMLRLDRIQDAALDLYEACKVALPFLKDCVARKSSSFSSQRIAADAQDSIAVIEAALNKAEGR